MKLSGRGIITSVQSEFAKQGFLPYENFKLGKRLGPGLMLHEAIRTSLGMKADDSIYMYWEWKELKPALDSLWLALDESSSRALGRVTTAIAFASDESRSLDEVLKMLSSVDTESIRDFPIVSRRPTKTESQVRFVGKLLGAILTTIGILEESRDSGYGDLLSSISLLPDSEIEFLSELDSQVQLTCTDVSKIAAPKNVVVLRALGWAFERTNELRLDEDQDLLTFGGFLRATEENANWSGMSDQVVLRRLLAIAPEKAETSLRAIEKFLSN
jgi:hypothetical protein